MSNHVKVDRKTFIKTMGAAVCGVAFGNWRAFAGTNLNPASINIGHITDTYFGDSDDPGISDKLHLGRLYGHAFALADDLMARFREDSSWPVDLVVHGGNLLRSGKRDQAVAALDWLKSQKEPVHLTFGESDSTPLGLNKKEFISRFSHFGFADGKGYYSYNVGGFHFIHLESPIENNLEQQQWIREDLAKFENVPTVVILHEPRRKEILSALFGAHRQVLVVLSGDEVNNADFSAGFLSLSTCSPVIYPCGARIIKIEVSNGNVSISSKFLQTRRLELFEESFHQLNSPKIIERLGSLKGRRFSLDFGKKLIEPVGYDTNPSLVPRIGSDSSVVMAVLADTHLCKDRYLDGEIVTQYQESASEYAMSGHFLEKDGSAIYSDILEQIIQGRHRVEFFDEVFDKNPQADANFLDAPVDALLVNGDLSEHGMFDETQVVLDGLNALPDRLRQSAFVTPGNHDLFRGDFIKENSGSSRKNFTDFFKGFNSPDGNTYYTVELAEWLTLIVIDSVIPTESAMGFIQEQIDWLEDQIAARRNQAVVVACHHPIYRISQLPRLMGAYLKMRSHDTRNVTSARTQLQEMFAKYNNVKLVISGHSHGTCTDQHRKTNPQGQMADDSFTTHIQTPCTIEYPNGYRLIKFSRSTNTVNIDYFTAYTRLAKLRAQSAQAKIFSLLGTDIKTPMNYANARNALENPENNKINSMDLIDLNVRGFKDGTTNNGLGNSSKPNINGKIEVTV